MNSYIRSGLVGLAALVAGATYNSAKAEPIPIIGTTYHVISAQPISDLPVSAMQEGQQDDDVTDQVGNYALFQTTSGIPEDLPPSDPEPSWGLIKLHYGKGTPLAGTTRHSGPLAMAAGEGELNIEGGSEYFNVEKYIGDATEPLQVNVSMIPRTYTSDNFGPATLDIEQVKTFYRVNIYGDNPYWDTDAYPIPIQLDDPTPQKLAKLEARIAQFEEKLGPTFKVAEPGEVIIGERGIYWITANGSNMVQPYFEEGSIELKAAVIGTNVFGYNSDNISRHELSRTLGVLGAATFPGYGMLNTSATAPTDKDWGTLDAMRKKRERSDAGQNNITLGDLFN